MTYWKLILEEHDHALPDFRAPDVLGMLLPFRLFRTHPCRILRTSRARSQAKKIGIPGGLDGVGAVDQVEALRAAIVAADRARPA